MSQTLRAVLVLNVVLLAYIVYEKGVANPLQKVVEVVHEKCGEGKDKKAEGGKSETGGDQKSATKTEEKVKPEEKSDVADTVAPLEQVATPEPTPETPAPTPAPTEQPVLYPNHPVIVSYMSHHPHSPDTMPYATAVFVYMSLYAAANQLNYVYYTSPPEVPPKPSDVDLPPDCDSQLWCRHQGDFKCTSLSCVGPKGCLLHPVWCKVKALRQALATYETAPFALSLDTDAIVRFEDFRVNLGHWVDTTLGSKGYSLDERPLVANQEQPGWWCNHMKEEEKRLNGFTYRWCVNTGVMLVGNSARGRGVVDFWWNSSLDDEGSNPLRYKFRKEWPWEQDRLTAMLNEERVGQFDNVQVLPTKEQFHQPDWNVAEQSPGECFGAVPRWRCLVNHFCWSTPMKKYWGNRTMAFALSMLQGCANGVDPVISMPVGEHDAVPPAYPARFEVSRDGWCTAEVAAIGVGVDFAVMNHPETQPDYRPDPAAHGPRYEFLQKAAEVLGKRHVVELP